MPRFASIRSGPVATSFAWLQPPSRRPAYTLALSLSRPVFSLSSIHPVSRERAQIQFSPRAFGVNFINLSGHRDYTARRGYFWYARPADKWRRFCSQRPRRRLIPYVFVKDAIEILHKHIALAIASIAFVMKKSFYNVITFYLSFKRNNCCNVYSVFYDIIFPSFAHWESLKHDKKSNK